MPWMPRDHAEIPHNAPAGCTPLLGLSLGLLAGGADASLLATDLQSVQIVEAPTPLTPDLAYPELFEAVQRRQLFDDQKHFVDELPLRAPALINADYLAQHEQPGFDLARFVDANFESSPSVATTDLEDHRDLRAHIDALWPRLVRSQVVVPAHSSLLALPHPYVVPGGRFREVYYWDSYFTMLGLVESHQSVLSRQMLDNFAHLIDRYGHVPNGNRTYYLSRSQPPFFSYMVELQAQVDGEETYRHYLPQLRREHAYWMAGADRVLPGQADRHVVRLRDGSLLNRYWDDRDTPRQEAWLHDVHTAAEAGNRPASEVYRDLRAGAESGWDFSSRWQDDPQSLATIRTTAMVPVDLNALLYHLETVLATACTLSADPCARDYTELAEQRRQAIERHLWNPAGFYADYDWQRERLSDRLTAATLFPLFADCTSTAHASRTARTVGERLLRPGGLATTELDTGQQWDEPNGWAPLQWVAVDGLRRHHQTALAREIGTRFLARVQALFGNEHKLVEKYAVDHHTAGGGGGEYPLQDGFGWTNGVALMLLDLYGGELHRPQGSTGAAQP